MIENCNAGKMLTILERLIDDATGGYYILKQFDGFHDFSGKSRSSTITLAFLLQKTSLTLEEAIVKVIINIHHRHHQPLCIDSCDDTKLPLFNKTSLR